jgi:hypothetical protein
MKKITPFDLELDEFVKEALIPFLKNNLRQKEINY